MKNRTGPAGRASGRGGVGAGIAGAGARGGTAAARPETASADTPRSVPFHGAHQAGITTPAQAHAAFVSFDVIAADRRELSDPFRTITHRAPFHPPRGAPPPPPGGRPPPPQRDPRAPPPSPPP